MLAHNHPEVHELGERMGDAIGAASLEGALSALAMVACFIIERHLPDPDEKAEVTRQFIELVTRVRVTDPNVGGLRTHGRGGLN